MSNAVSGVMKQRRRRPCEVCARIYKPKTKRSFFCSLRCRVTRAKKYPRHQTAQRIAYMREYNRKRTSAGADMAKRHGVLKEVMNAWLDTGCYYPGGNHKGRLGVDHDHDHCPGRYGCGLCARGLLCERHNGALGGIERDLGFTVWVMQQPMLQNKIRREA